MAREICLGRPGRAIRSSPTFSEFSWGRLAKWGTERDPPKLLTEWSSLVLVDTKERADRFELSPFISCQFSCCRFSRRLDAETSFEVLRSTVNKQGIYGRVERYLSERGSVRPLIDLFAELDFLDSNRNKPDWLLKYKRPTFDDPLLLTIRISEFPFLGYGDLEQQISVSNRKVRAILDEIVWLFDARGESYSAPAEEIIQRISEQFSEIIAYIDVIIRVRPRPISYKGSSTRDFVLRHILCTGTPPPSLCHVSKHVQSGQRVRRGKSNASFHESGDRRGLPLKVLRSLPGNNSRGSSRNHPLADGSNLSSRRWDHRQNITLGEFAWQIRAPYSA